MTGPPPGRRGRDSQVPAFIMRVWDGSVTRLRAEYTFALARLCACPPPLALQLRLLDFARLIDAIDRYDQAMRRDGG